MAYYHTKSLSLTDGPVEELVRELKKQLPEDANTVAVFICAESFVKPDAGRVAGYPLYFEQPSTHHTVGTIWLGYGQGNLELLEFPPLG